MQPTSLNRLTLRKFNDSIMGNTLPTRFTVALMDWETGPTPDPAPGIDQGAYKSTLIERFANSAIKDTVKRVNIDAPLNILVDPIRDRLRTGSSMDLLTEATGLLGF